MSKRSMSASLALSGKKTSIPHNNREMNEGDWNQKRNQHIDRNIIDENVTLKQVDIEDIYEQRFGESLEKYNAKQKRKDRKIDNYYEHVKGSKKTNEQQEMIIQVGDMDDILDGTLGHEEAKEMLEEWYEGFEERNPNLAVYNAVIHMDEIYKDGETITTPHIHLNFVPVASGYKRGLEKQVAFDRALLQQNDEYDKTKPFKDWRQSEVNEMAKIMQSRGIERKEVGTHEGMTVDRYKEVKDRERAVKENETKLSNKVDTLRNQIGERNEQFRQVKANLDRRASNLDDREQGLENRENTLKNRESGLNEHIKTFNERVKAKEQELKEREERSQKKEQQTALKASQVDSKAIQVNNKAIQLKRHERALNERESKVTIREQAVNKAMETLNNMKSTIKGQFERTKEWYKGMNNKTDSELRERRRLNNEEIKRVEKAEELTFSDDDLKDLTDDKGLNL